MIRRRSARKGRATTDIIVSRRDTGPPTVAEEIFEHMATTGEVPTIAPEWFPPAQPRR